MSALLDRLEQGPVICAEGYLFEFERRGYLQAGAFVPEVVLEHPEMVAELHREFVHAGLGRGRGLHLLRPPREAAADRQGAPAGGDEPAGARRSPRGWRPRPARCWPATSATPTSSTGDDDSDARCAACSRSRSAGRPRRGSTSSSPRRSRWRGEALIALDVIKRRRPAGGDHARRSTSEPDDARGLVAGGGVPAPGGGGRGRRRAQLHPRPETMLPLLEAIRERGDGATSRRCRCRTAPPTSSRRSSR